MGWEGSWMVEHLLGMYQALVSIWSTDDDDGDDSCNRGGCGGVHLKSQHLGGTG